MSFCPFLKDECQGNQCVIWYDEQCLIAAFLQNIHTGLEKQRSAEEEILVDEPRFEFRRPETVVPEEIKQATPETIAAEFLDFLETEFPDSKTRIYGGNFDLFLQTKNLTNRWNLPPEINLKIQKAQALAREGIRQKNEAEHRKRFEDEKVELPSLVSRCCDWAISKGMKRVTVADVDAFILENDLDMLKETKRALYSLTNVELKSK